MTSPATPDPTASATTALAPGALYVMVAAHLAEHPDTAWKIGEITTAIGARSSGAVMEACKRMLTAGYAIHQANPHRFQITTAGATAVADGTLPPPGPRTSRGVGPRTVGTGSSAAKAAPVTRPGGQLYYPRRLGERTDVEALRQLRDSKIAVLLYGPPGTGKTALIEAAFPDLITLTGTDDTTVEDFLGSYHPLPDGTFEYVYGPMVNAMLTGGVLFVDDATLIRPKVLAVLYSVMDGRDEIILSAYRNERVKAADGFYVIAAFTDLGLGCTGRTVACGVVRVA
jgi:nitric oxide reductase NorQ protein